MNCCVLFARYSVSINSRCLLKSLITATSIEIFPALSPSASKLKGKISFTIITDNRENLVVSNGFSVIRPKDDKSLVIIFANLFTEAFKIQHQSMVTGSIMETLSDKDIKNIYIKEDIDHDKYNTILSSITILNRELITLG